MQGSLMKAEPNGFPDAPKELASLPKKPNRTPSAAVHGSGVVPIVKDPTGAGSKPDVQSRRPGLRGGVAFHLLSIIVFWEHLRKDFDKPGCGFAGGGRDRIVRQTVPSE